jgi:hypothetical protein
VKIRHKVWFGRARGVLWLIGGLLALLFGVTDSVALVWWASVYANAESGFATAEGADDRAVLEAIAELRAEVRRLADQS